MLPSRIPSTLHARQEKDLLLDVGRQGVQLRALGGLKHGDHWCLCVARWKEALDAGCPPQVVLAATHISALEFVTLDDLTAHAVDVE